MIDFGVVWTVLTRPATLAVLALTCALAWPLGRRRGRLGVLFVLTLGAILAATATNWLFANSVTTDMAKLIIRTLARAAETSSTR